MPIIWSQHPQQTLQNHKLYKTEHYVCQLATLDISIQHLHDETMILPLAHLYTILSHPDKTLLPTTTNTPHISKYKKVALRAI